jgi:hypothetical protein
MRNKTHIIVLLWVALTIILGCKPAISTEELSFSEEEITTSVPAPVPKNRTFSLIATTPYRIELTADTFRSVANNPQAQRNWQWAVILPMFSVVDLLDMPPLVVDEQRQVAIAQPTGQRGYVNADWLAPVGFVPAITTEQATIYSYPSGGSYTLYSWPALSLVAVNIEEGGERFIPVYGILTVASGDNFYTRVIKGYLEKNTVSTDYSDAQALMLYQHSFGMNTAEMKKTLLQAQALRPTFLGQYIKARLALFDEITLPKVLEFTELIPSPYTQLQMIDLEKCYVFAMPSTKSLMLQILRPNTLVQIKYIVHTHEGYWYFIPETGWILASDTQLKPEDVVSPLSSTMILGNDGHAYSPLQ